MLTGKQRAYLRSQCNGMDTIVQIGKGGVTPAVLAQAQEALTAREMIKLRVLENSLLSAKEAAIAMAEALPAEVVQVIGTKFVLYQPRKKEPIYHLPR